MIADYKITSFSVLFPSHNRSAVDCVTGIKTAFQQLEDESCLKKGTYSNPHSPPYSLSNLLQRPKAQEIHRCYQYSSHHLSRQYFTMQMQTQSHFQPVRLSRACLPPALPCGLPAWGTRHLAPGTWHLHRPASNSGWKAARAQAAPISSAPKQTNSA